ncbi:MAG: radical SAM family heme chaperone HemW [Candidatus Omnitrophota bacterium]
MNSTKLSLYVHIPFCVSKCPYCSFAVVAGALKHEAAYVAALAREPFSGRPAISTIYIGGGTPSCLSMRGIEALFEMINARFDVARDAEVTFEMNPESVDPAKAVLLKRLGVNRVSLGVQSLNDRTLELLGRPHRNDDARRAFSVLRAAGFADINVDMIYGLPGQGAREVLADLGDLLSLGSEHCSLYTLNVEERSLFFARRMEVDPDAQGGLYSAVCQAMEEAGVKQYEVSNFARPGFESRHNIHYWNGGDYIGLGMAAHAHLAGERSWNADTLPKYLELMKEKGTAKVGSERLPPAEKLLEVFLFGLRMNRGVDLGSLEARFGLELPHDKKEKLESFIEMGLLEEDDTHIRATPRGRLLLDELAARII